jgi:hypothetical protein
MTRAPEPAERPTGPRLWLFAGILVLLLVVVVEVLARVLGPSIATRLGIDIKPVDRILAEQSEGIRTLLDNDRTLVQLDSVLGWRYRPGYVAGENDLNAAGLRAKRDYSERPPAGVRRVAAFGDSFVYGTEVATDDAWATVAERETPGLEVLNYGVGGYGTDQAFLLFLREGMRFAPEIVLIGFAPVDLRRAVNVYRRFISTDDLPIAKPRFRLDPAGRLQLVPSPIRDRADWNRLIAEPRATLASFAPHDPWYEPLRYESAMYRWSATARLGIALGYRLWWKYRWEGRLMTGREFRPESEAFAVQRALLNSFADSVRARGARPLIVIFPDRESVAEAAPGVRPVYAPLREALEGDGRAEVLDLLDALVAERARTSVDSLFAPGRHYSARANAVVADAVSRRLVAP